MGLSFSQLSDYPFESQAPTFLLLLLLLVPMRNIGPISWIQTDDPIPLSMQSDPMEQRNIDALLKLATRSVKSCSLCPASCGLSDVSCSGLQSNVALSCRQCRIRRASLERQPELGLAVTGQLCALTPRASQCFLGLCRVPDESLSTLCLLEYILFFCCFLACQCGSPCRDHVRVLCLVLVVKLFK